MNSFLLTSLSNLGSIGYILIFLGMIVEGDAVLFTSAFLVHRGVLDFTPALFAVLWGIVLGDNFWYSLGVKLRNSKSFLNNWAERVAKPFEAHLLNNPLRTIFISKFTYGFNHAILMRAGALKIRWKKLEQSDILASILWIILVGGLGYFSSASFYLVRRYLRFGEAALVIGLFLFFGLEYWVTKKTKTRL